MPSIFQPPKRLLTPRLQVSVNVDKERRTLEAEIAALQLKINGLRSDDYSFRLGGSRKTFQAKIAEKQTRLSALLDPSATPGVTPAPAPPPIFGSPRIEIGRFGVSDLKLFTS